MRKMIVFEKTNAGFTLVEMMVTVLISMVIMAGIFGAYRAQQKSHVAQDGVAEMQQNSRAAFMYILKDIREATADPTRDAFVGITEATAGVFSFTADLKGGPINPNEANGVIEDNEKLSYGFSKTYDPDRNGIAGGGTDWSVPGEFGRGVVEGGNMSYKSIADYVEAVEFNYVFTDGSTATTVIGAKKNKIEAVQVSLLVRTSKVDPDYTNRTTYTTAANTDWGPFNDNFRRHLAITTIEVRNRTF